MRKFLITTASALILATACAGVKTQTPAKPSSSVQKAQTGELEQAYDLQAQYDKIATVDLTTTDTSFLNAEQRQVVNLLIEAAGYMNEIYLRQVATDNPKTRQAIVDSDRADKALLLKMFDRHFGPWDTIDHDKPFFGNTPKPRGGGFYPTDMSKEEFENWIAAHPQDEKAFKSWYTVIERKGDKLVAIPYHEAYKQWLVPASEKLSKAASITTNPSLKKYLSSRAKALLDDEYYESEMAWMDLKDTPIEVTIGPYEVYTDKIFGQKTAYEAFVTIKNPKESAALDKYKTELRDMEANLPVTENYKNFDRGFESPIAVTYQIHGGGDNVPGVQTIAFNLPNDERVREAKGAKKVLLNNVLGAKFDLILEPMAHKVLVAEQADMLVKKYMSFETLFHELSHSMGPGSITIDGRATTVSAELKDLYSKIEEGKADVMGAYNILYMMEKGELPKSEKKAMLATYFTGLFRAMRWGTDEAHGGGAAYQYTYFKEVGAISWDEKSMRFKIDFDRFEQAISDLTAKVVMIEGDGNYDKAKTFLDTYSKIDDHAKQVIKRASDLPTDIAPIYPEKI